ncbi:alpha/beta-hydrolase [Lindgomyces ingoldianus]|uniref:Alpha/beta-hydrolase n=1 Tax=Lindgomyces ingoldianus TaxID=673940 RepID=A0ACB6QMG0_9PLEO|nr:alpha/beta-hydrolase [Lindgomyces ingoldianus]KAF2467317.1 alpha/beta-hydrolase [Lindgomyces ingoldianus]
MIDPSLTLFGLFAFASAKPLSTRSNATNTTTVWSFAEVASSASLQWTPCFENFSCANLEVPLDYTKPDVGTINVAFLKKEALQQPAMGDILINPGGPGVSGIDYVLQGSVILERLLGTAYNIVGFDPRGVNNSGPHLDCFQGSPAIRDYYDSTYYSDVDLKCLSSMSKHFQAAGAFGDWCSRSLSHEANYANTPATARDMLQYIKVLAESRGESPNDAKLNYYGVSYGSTLGITYAALFPDHVGRMIIDGVVDAEDYYSGAWKQNLVQADEAVQGFFESCYQAGPSCAFFRNDSSAKDIERRANAILKDIEENPISVADPAFVDFPTVITGQDVRGALLLSLYSAISGFPLIASMLSGLEARNGSIMIPLLEAVQPRLLIACNDANGRYNISTVGKWHDYVRDLEMVSTYVGEVWATVIILQCRSLQFTPPANQLFYGFNTTITSHPILFTANRIDPVTSSGDKMSKLFPGSVVLKQDTIGHGLQVAQSDCISRSLQKFLECGELPPENTMCDTEVHPFQAGVKTKRIPQYPRGLGI